MFAEFTTVYRTTVSILPTNVIWVETTPLASDRSLTTLHTVSGTVEVLGSHAETIDKLNHAAVYHTVACAFATAETLSKLGNEK
jgi:hypothetical protein